MAKRRLLWQLYPLYLAATVLALAAITVYALRSFEKFFWEETATELKDAASLVGQMVAALPSVDDGRAIDAICKEAGTGVAKRITVVLPSGVVVGDSDEDPATMENHSDRPEVRAALVGGIGVATRQSRTLGRELMYVALPVVKGGRTIAVARASMPVKALSGIMHHLDTRIAIEGLIVALLAAVAILIFSKRALKPLEEIRIGAHRFREGDLSYRLRAHGPAEVQSLAETMNQMAAALEARMERLKQLEDMRREFVANVSHELKTPVTSIRGFAETLRDGALADPERAKQYLEIVAAHAGRLSAIIEDLLQLSRIEQETQNGGTVEREHGAIRAVLEAAIGICAGAAREKNIRIELTCADGISAVINAPLLEQAVVNLIDNAIKYSDEGTSVRIEASADGGGIAILVRDEGPGIAAEHLPRIFERFYRVDKGRSRKEGGTGLGLAIVKHIVQLHGGEVGVESEVGKGSAFTIRMPMS